MSHSRRLSQSMTGSWTMEASGFLHSGNHSGSVDSVDPPSKDVEEWLGTWRNTFARDLIDMRVVPVDADTSVEDACELLLTENIACLAVRGSTTSDIAPTQPACRYLGLFDYADVNSFLTLAATRHTLLPDDLKGNSRVNDIVTAAKAGQVPVHLVSNLSDKNPIEILPYDATLVSLLEVFAKGTHRTLIKSSVESEDFLGMVSDRRLLAWFDAYAKETTSFKKYLTTPIQYLSLPSLNLNDAVVAAYSSATILDAMKLMSEQGVSSIAVLEEKNGSLLSAVSVTDVGKIVVPSQSNQILTMPLHYFIGAIKDPDGSTDGVDKFPVYSVVPSSLLSYTMHKLLATQSHRVFVTHESTPGSPTMTPVVSSNLTGIVSIVDILSLFARCAKVQHVDPTHMQRHRRASSASSQVSDREQFSRSRSNSRTSVHALQRSPMILASSPVGIPVLDGAPLASGIIEPLSLQRSASRKSISAMKKNSLG